MKSFLITLTAFSFLTTPIFAASEASQKNLGDFRDVAKKAIPAVVSIKVKGTSSS